MNIEHHIFALREEAKHLDAAADEYGGLAVTVERTTAIILFRAMASAKRNTAETLEREFVDGD
jgi:hypothetical protein